MIVTAFESVGLLSSSVLNHRLAGVFSPPTEALLGIGLGLLFCLAVTPFIYRRFHWRPLLYPLCPQCGDKNRVFLFVSAKPNWPLEQIACCKCHSLLDLWYEPLYADTAVSANLPSFTLLWPQSFGGSLATKPLSHLQIESPIHTGHATSKISFRPLAN